MGQFIDVSMLESMLSLTLTELQAAQFPLTLPRRPLFGPVETSDGFVMLAVASEKTFQNLVKAAGHPELQSDARFQKYADRRANWAELMEIIEAWSRRLDSAECLAQLERHGVPSSPYRTVSQALADPQIAHRGAMTEVEDAGGVFKALNPPFRMSRADTSAGRRSPRLGEHTREVLVRLGLTETEIDELL
jgi:CoA:oxalate CoA-transferase